MLNYKFSPKASKCILALVALSFLVVFAVAVFIAGYYTGNKDTIDTFNKTHDQLREQMLAPTQTLEAENVI